MKYAIQPGVLLETVCDEHLLIATGEARGKVPYVKNLNETGVWFWQLFENSSTSRRSSSRPSKPSISARKRRTMR